MPRVAVVCLSAALLAGSPAGAQSPGWALCEVGRSALELIHFESAAGFNPPVHGKINPIDLRSSIIFLAECPSSVMPAFSHFDEEPELHRAWIAAVQAATRNSSSVEDRGFLAAAEASVKHQNDHSLNQFLDGIFGGLAHSGHGSGPSLDSLLEQQALATLKRHAECDGAGCFDASDNVLFLLGTHPLAVLRAMRSDSIGAASWLSAVKGESFAGPPDRSESREAARRAILSVLSAVKAPGLEPEQRARVDTLTKVRYRAVD